MSNAIDFAKFLIKQAPTDFDNSFDGNMKLQKLLFFANMIHLAENKSSLFDDNIQAFKKGCVVDNVRVRYYYSYDDLKKDSLKFEPTFSEKEFQSINKVMEIFGHLSPKVLSDLTHEFDFWKEHYKNSINPDGSYDQQKNVITVDDMMLEADKISNVLTTYRANKTIAQKFDVINGIKFYFDDEIEITDDIMDDLYDFSTSEEAEDESYNVYYENGELVVY